GAAPAAASLQEQAARLRDAVGAFRVGETAQRDGARSAEPAFGGPAVHAAAA
ncbi:hypothetical protein B1M_33632, partial [Burkholderia sp. TJI49]